MSLDARIVTRIGGFDLDAQITCAPGETVALLGPNGAGKSTALRTISGLQPISDGRIVIGDTVVDDPAKGQFLPPERRRVGVVFQDYVLFPHMTVRQNIAFGPRSTGLGEEGVPHWLDALGIADLAERKPSQLSGGQAQRVALARALATDPRLLLMDEPLAALDAATRIEVRGRLRHHLDAFAHGTVIVTHDPLDALVLADRIIVIEDGRVAQEGPTAHVAAQPRTAYLAALLGVTLIRGTARNGVVTCTGGGQLITSDTSVHGDVVALVRPQAISLHHERPEGSARNVWHTAVTSVDIHGDQVRVNLAGPPALVAAVTPAAVAELGITPGQRIWASLKATDISVHPA